VLSRFITAFFQLRLNGISDCLSWRVSTTNVDTHTLWRCKGEAQQEWGSYLWLSTIVVNCVLNRLPQWGAHAPPLPRALSLYILCSRCLAVAVSIHTTSYSIIPSCVAGKINWHISFIALHIVANFSKIATRERLHPLINFDQTHP
jgi:hypothetical protein